MRMANVFAIIHLGIVLTVFSIAAHAEESTDPCASDIQKFCADVKVATNGLTTCLKQKKAELSVECKNQVVKHEAKQRRGHGRPQLRSN